MMDRPDSYDDPGAWFNYFRMTKHLPAMSVKFHNEITKAPDAGTARMIMTAYVATACDILMTHHSKLNVYFKEDLGIMFDLKPNDLYSLSVKDIAVLFNCSADSLEKYLDHEGFKVENGRIAGLHDPDAKPRLSNPPIKPTKPFR